MNLEFFLHKYKCKHANAKAIMNLFNDFQYEISEDIDYNMYKPEHYFLSCRLIKRLVCQKNHIPFTFECYNCKCDISKGEYYRWGSSNDNTDNEFICTDCNDLYVLQFGETGASQHPEDNEEYEYESDESDEEFDFVTACKRVKCTDECIICRDQKTLYSFFPNCEHTVCFDCFIQMTPMRCVYKCC